MAVTTGATSVKRYQIDTNHFMLFAQIDCFGDASGGTVSADCDLSTYLPQASIVTMLDAGYYNDDAAGRAQCVALYTANWQFQRPYHLVGTNTTHELTATVSGTTRYFSGDLHKLCKFPKFLGRAVTASPSFYYQCQTNTNGKTYVGWVLLDVVTTT